MLNGKNRQKPINPLVKTPNHFALADGAPSKKTRSRTLNCAWAEVCLDHQHLVTVGNNRIACAQLWKLFGIHQPRYPYCSRMSYGTWQPASPGFGPHSSSLSQSLCCV